MLTLFPKFKKRLILFEVLYIALMVVLYILKPGANSIAMLLMLLVGALLIAAAQYINAVNAHNRQLNRLYNQLDVEGFLKEYEPHLKQNPSNPNLYTMIRMHISNAYAAQGRFEDAMKLLSSIQVKEGKKPEQALIQRYTITSQSLLLRRTDGRYSRGKKYLDELHRLKKQLEDIQETKPMKQRMAFSSELNDQCMALLTTGKADIEKLKTQVQQNNTQQLHRVTTSLWIGPRLPCRTEPPRSRNPAGEDWSSSRLTFTPARKPRVCWLLCPPSLPKNNPFSAARNAAVFLYIAAFSDASLPLTEYLVEKSLQKNAFFCKKGVAFSAEP